MLIMPRGPSSRPGRTLREYLESREEERLDLREQSQAELVENFEQLLVDAENAMPSLME